MFVRDVRRSRAGHEVVRQMTDSRLRSRAHRAISSGPCHHEYGTAEVGGVLLLGHLLTATSTTGGIAELVVRLEEEGSTERIVIVRVVRRGREPVVGVVGRRHLVEQIADLQRDTQTPGRIVGHAGIPQDPCSQLSSSRIRIVVGGHRCIVGRAPITVEVERRAPLTLLPGQRRIYLALEITTVRWMPQHIDLWVDDVLLARMLEHIGIRRAPYQLSPRAQFHAHN